MAEAIRTFEEITTIRLQEGRETFGAGTWLRTRLERETGRVSTVVARTENASPAVGFRAAYGEAQARLARAAPGVMETRLA